MTLGEPAGDGLFRYPVDPHALVDQVMIDPRFQPAEASELKRKIEDRTGYQGEFRSSLQRCTTLLLRARETDGLNDSILQMESSRVPPSSRHSHAHAIASP